MSKPGIGYGNPGDETEARGQGRADEKASCLFHNDGKHDAQDRQHRCAEQTFPLEILSPRGNHADAEFEGCIRLDVQRLGKTDGRAVLRFFELFRITGRAGRLDAHGQHGRQAHEQKRVRQ